MEGKDICDFCDGCGWYEGGPTLQTTCEKCSGTGWVDKINYSTIDGPEIAKSEPYSKSAKEIINDLYKDEKSLPNVGEIVVCTNQLIIVEPKDMSDKDLLLVCRESMILHEKYFNELFNRFETYARVQSVFSKLNRGQL